MNPDPAQGAIQTKDVVTWIVTGLLFVGNLCFSIYNLKLTRRTAGEKHEFDEWKSRRADVQTVLRGFEATVANVIALSGAAHKLPSLREEVHKEGAALSRSHNALVRELQRAGNGEVAWADLAYGRTSGGDTDWDLINVALSKVDDKVTPDEARTALRTIDAFAKSIADGIDEQLRITSAEHNPNRL